MLRIIYKVKSCDLKSQIRPYSVQKADVTNQRKVIDRVINSLKIKDKSDLYNISVKTLKENGGEEIVQIYSDPFKMFSTLYPEYPWLPWKFSKCPDGYWDDINNQRKYMDWLGKNLGYKDLDDWYSVGQKDFKGTGGMSMIRLKYAGSHSACLAAVYPEHNWLPWKFAKASNSFWSSLRNQQQYCDWAATQLGIKNKNDWYKISVQAFKKIEGAASLLKKYSDSLPPLLKTIYPDYDWQEWMFVRTPRNFWNNKENALKFFSWAFRELKLNNLDDWYNVTTQDIIKLGGAGMFQHGTVSKALMEAYPEHKWEVYRFSTLNKPWEQLLKDEETKNDYVKYLEKELEIINFNDWKKITMTDLNKVKLPPNWNLSDALELVGIVKSRTASFKKSQWALKAALQKIVKEEMVEEYRHPDISNFELDFFFPKLKLAFEFHGQQHYKALTHLHNTFSVHERREIDKKKIELCKENGITLFSIPFWWDREVSSLVATIYAQRPDLFKTKPVGKPIPETFQLENNKVKNKNALDMMNVTVWEDSMDPTGWLMSEKYDGMRLLWDGTRFHTRHGKKPNMPANWLSEMPKIALDGELWTQYGLYQDSIVLSRHPDHEKWKQAIFYVFDAPDLKVGYEERIDTLNKMTLPSFVKIVNYTKCEGTEHLKEFFNSIVQKKGEGVILREPGSLYSPGRSPSLRKYKEYFDTEVTVKKNLYPHGFDCIQPNGKVIFVGLSDNAEEAKKIKVGAKITVKHLGENVYGTLQYPKFFRERLDVL